MSKHNPLQYQYRKFYLNGETVIGRVSPVDSTKFLHKGEMYYVRQSFPLMWTESMIEMHLRNREVDGFNDFRWAQEDPRR